MTQNTDPEYIDRLPALIQVFQSLANFNNLEDLLKFVIGSVTRLIDAERSSLFLVDDQNNELYSTIAEGTGGQEIRFPVGTGIAGSVAQKKATILIPDAYSDPRFNPAFDVKSGFKTRNILCMPMQNIEGKVIGVIQVLNKCVGGFLPSDELLLSSFCTHAAVCIESTLLFCKMEEIVSSRTRELSLALESNRLILENIKDGFLICDRFGTIQSGYSKSCESHLKQTNLSGQNLLKSEFLPLNPAEGDCLKNLPEWIQYGFDNPEMNQWEELSEMRVKLKGSFLNLRFQRLFQNAQVTSLMVLISDISEQIQLEEEVAQKEMESSQTLISISSMIQHGKAQFEHFLQQLKEGLTEMSQLLVKSPIQNIDSIFRIAHTLKGLSLQFSMEHIAAKLHQEEDRLTIIRSQGSLSPEESQFVEAGVQALLTLAARAEAVFEKVFLGVDSDRISIPKSEWNALLAQLPPQIYEQIIKYQPNTIHWISNQLKMDAQKVAEALGKQVEIITQLRPTEFSQKVSDKLLGCLMHLIRNALDHGMETPEERTRLGKKPSGFISISMTEKADCFHLSIKDDGRGLNLDKIRLKAKDKFKIHKSMSKSELQNLIFEPGFSTQEQASVVSGRGVGLDYVKATIMACGGNISVESDPGIGTCFFLNIPKHYELQDKAEHPGL